MIKSVTVGISCSAVAALSVQSAVEAANRPLMWLCIVAAGINALAVALSVADVACRLRRPKS